MSYKNVEDKRRYARKWTRKDGARVRAAILALYGPKCVKCGYDADLRALQLDHINRAKVPRGHWLRSGHQLYRKVLAGVFPKEDFQLLCANCNYLKKLDNKEFYSLDTI